MTYLPSYRDWQELLSTPHMARLTQANGEDGLELTLVVRCRTLEIKYMMQSDSLSLISFKSKNNIMCYGLISHDDPVSPLVLWSACRDLKEYALLDSLETKRSINIHLYNEVCINVASATFSIILGDKFSVDMENPEFEIPSQPIDRSDVSAKIDVLKNNLSRRATLMRSDSWHGAEAHLIQTPRSPFKINLITDEEGRHQEQLAGWLSESVNPDLIVLNTKCKEPKGESEFADITMSYSNGPIIMESKALSIIGRANLPSRDRLQFDVEKKIQKAIKQLKGGCRTIYTGRKVFDDKGIEVIINRERPAHAICLVPDISLVAYPAKYAAEFCKSFLKNNAFFHLMDLAHLYRMVQGAQMVSADTSRPAMECFDAYLVQRHDIVMAQNTMLFDMAIDISGDKPRVKVQFGSA